MNAGMSSLFCQLTQQLVSEIKPFFGEMSRKLGKHLILGPLAALPNGNWKLSYSF
jgi:hypothetical protein